MKTMQKTQRKKTGKDIMPKSIGSNGQEQLKLFDMSKMQGISEHAQEPSVLDKIRMVLFRPMKFFEKIQHEQGMKHALFYYLGFLVLMLLVSLKTLPGVVDLLFQRFGWQPDASSYFVFTIFSFIGTAALMFVYAYIIHAFTRIWKASMPFSETFKAVAYAGTPSYLMEIFLGIVTLYILPLFFATIPLGINIVVTLLSICAAAYQYFLVVIGVTRLQKLSAWKAGLCAVILPLALILLLILLVSFVVAIIAAFYLQGAPPVTA